MDISIRNFCFLPGNDTWLIWFRILLDRNVYNKDGSSPPFLSQFTNGISTDATLTDGCNLIDAFLTDCVIFSMHLARFSSLQKNSIVSKLDESQKVRFAFNRIVRVINIILFSSIQLNSESSFLFVFYRQWMNWICFSACVFITSLNVQLKKKRIVE